MIISDLHYLETVQDTNVKGAVSYAYFQSTISNYSITGNRIADGSLTQSLVITADVLKTVTFTQNLTALAEV